ncbi:hypothetical protein [Stenotrophomonas sp. PS02289]|uniref:hypothetical protein n=1 Tax=Stenotrophomonas sp. PS02289 TaxID=2991422 RepID=UPI00249C5B66|nr:hypothetical protein [Stenotrophomonas sp. PS02289]
MPVVLAACERAYSVSADIQNSAILPPSELREVLDSLWNGSAVPEVSFPEEFDPRSLKDHLDMLVYCALDLARNYFEVGTQSPQSIVSLVLDIADAIDGDQCGEHITGPNAVDVFLMDPFSCSSIELGRQMQDLADAGASVDAIALSKHLRLRSSGQRLMQDWSELND